MSQFTHFLRQYFGEQFCYKAILDFMQLCPHSHDGHEHMNIERQDHLLELLVGLLQGLVGLVQLVVRLVETDLELLDFLPEVPDVAVGLLGPLHGQPGLLLEPSDRLVQGVSLT